MKQVTHLSAVFWIADEVQETTDATNAKCFNRRGFNCLVIEKVNGVNDVETDVLELAININSEVDVDSYMKEIWNDWKQLIESYGGGKEVEIKAVAYVEEREEETVADGKELTIKEMLAMLDKLKNGFRDKAGDSNQSEIPEVKE